MLDPHVLLLSLALALGPGSAPVQDEPVLRSGEPHVGELRLGPFSDGVALLRVEVPADAVALQVGLSCRKADLDLYVYPVDAADEESTLSSTLAYGIDRVVVDRFSAPTIEAGTYQIDVEYPIDRPPVWEGETLSKVEYSVTATVLRARVDAVLEPGVPVESRIETSTGRFRSFRVDVPAGAPALRIDVADTHGDLDLFARRGEPILHIEQALHSAETYYGRETLLVTPESRPKLRPGAWYVDVVDYGYVDEPPIPFTLLATFAAEPPAQLLVVPPMRTPEDGQPLSRALCAVVDLYAGQGGGSGTLLSEDGWILTNAHVVSDFADQPVEEVVVAATIDRSRPAVEMFRARVARFDWERDLALLEITSGFYDQPLPEGYRFPTVALARADELEFGAPLRIVGYPWTGGLGGRVSITVVQGIVCGFEAALHGAWIKTDAEIAQGNSGGAAVNERGELVGVPTSVIEGTASQLSYIVPVTAIPAEWLELVGR